MYYLPTSCLVFFFLFSLFHLLSCVSRQQELRLCETLFQCGNITAGFPFSGENRPLACGYPSLKLHCYKNKTSIIILNLLYDVLDIDQTSNTLRLSRAELLGSFCNATFTATTFPPEIFELSPNYKNLTVFYLCDPKLHYRSSYKCPGRGTVSVSENLDYQSSCDDSFTINVPKSFVPEEKELNITDLESVLSKGFEVMVKIDEKACKECSSFHGICGFENTTQVCCNEASSSKCNKLHLPDDNDLHRRCSGTFSCGDQSGLLYPFWKTGREGCGHPDFKLECNARVAEVSISSVKFRILEANYVSGIIRLARSDYITDLCPQDPLNAMFNETAFPFASNTELITIYYDCGRDFPVSPFIGELDCEDDNRRNYYVTRNLSSPLLGGIRESLNDFRERCNKNVSIPISGPALATLQSISSTDNLKKALEEGFEIVNKDCSTCIGSGGACGYNQSSSSFTCYYIVETQQNSPRKKKGLSAGVIAGIVAASGAAVAILIAGAWFCIIRRRRKTQASSQYTTSKDLPITSYSTSKATSSYPTSTTISSSSNHSLVPSISNLGNFGVQVFSYEELEEATENFSRELGDGGFGTVYYGVLKDGRAVAVKRLYERSLKRVEQFKNEIEILKSLKHPNLVILYGCTSRHSRELLLVYEYISNGTLAEHLHGDRAESRPLCWTVRLNVAIETASALSYLHKSGIIHRDVKTTNILLDENSTVKVADFGLSRLFPMDQTHVSTAPQGTPGYVDPEYYQCYRLNEKSDVYSFGVVLAELISSKEAVDITRHRHDINLSNMAVSKIQNDALHELVDPSLGFDKDPEVRRRMMSVAELAFRCLQQEREVRPSMDEIVEILRGIKEKEEIRESSSAPDVVDLDGNSGDDVGLLRHSVPPPISPETDKWTSSSDTAASSF
uniref:non-specific serine/threonine protein kinase n=1 Tax=Noccaea caerulescens TaxID=107243 RepID=A0A1J3DRZ1_NOCCA